MYNATEKEMEMWLNDRQGKQELNYTNTICFRLGVCNSKCDRF